jgi:Tol biopolymer transport system component
MNADGAGAYNLTQARRTSASAWSPDGQWIAFTSNRDGNQEIYLQRADGSELRNLTQTPANDAQPAWLGDWMVFVSDRDGNQEIYRMRLDGSELANLTQKAQDVQPYIAPDGSQMPCQQPGWQPGCI